VAESRIQVTASGMAAMAVSLAAVVRAGDRVVLHSPAWPNVGNAALLRGAMSMNCRWPETTTECSASISINWNTACAARARSF